MGREFFRKAILSSEPTNQRGLLRGWMDELSVCDPICHVSDLPLPQHSSDSFAIKSLVRLRLAQVLLMAENMPHIHKA